MMTTAQRLAFPRLKVWRLRPQWRSIEMPSEMIVGGHRFFLRKESAAQAVAALRMINSGYPIPFSSAVEWSQYAQLRSWFLEIEDIDGRSCGGTAIRLLPSRSLPGFRVLRVERLGANIAPEAIEATFSALARIARSAPRVLRLDVEAFSTTDERFESIRVAAERVGLRAAASPREYTRTLLIPLGHDIETLFNSLHSTARRHIRAAAKKGLMIRPISDLDCAAQMDSLLRETLDRTGGEYAPHDWGAIIRYSADYPQRSRIVGLFSPDDAGVERLLAFAWGCCHGDHVHYSTAASTRREGIRVPMGYPLAWDLITWSHSLNAAFFDFGGITDGDHGSADPVGGISDFKRYFGGHTVECGQEWILTPNRVAASTAWLSARIARGLSRITVSARRRS
jgi:hypothetical protein